MITYSFFFNDTHWMEVDEACLQYSLLPFNPECLRMDAWMDQAYL